MAAAFRSIGIHAEPTPDSDAETLELGGLHSSGEECLPHKVTLGDFLKICRRPGADPRKLAFFMPRAPGPCRFGQYAPYLKQVLESPKTDPDVKVALQAAFNKLSESVAVPSSAIHSHTLPTISSAP